MKGHKLAKVDIAVWYTLEVPVIGFEASHLSKLGLSNAELSPVVFSDFRQLIASKHQYATFWYSEVLRNSFVCEIMANKLTPAERLLKEKEIGKYLRLACKDGVSECYYRLGSCHELGDYTCNKDEVKAAAFYKLSSEVGDPNGMYNYGRFMFEGKGGLKAEPVKGLALISTASRAGVSEAKKYYDRVAKNRRLVR